MRSKSKPRRWQAVLGALCWLGCAGLEAYPAAADQSDPAASAAIAHVVKSVVSFTRWPILTEPRRLCLIAAPRAAAILQSGWSDAYGHTVQANPMSADDPALRSSCDIVYLGDLESSDQRRLISRLAGAAILSLTESDPDCSTGAMFCLKSSGIHVGFDINLDAVSRSGVRVHPGVLRLSSQAWAQP